MKNNKIAPVGDYAPRLENQSSRAILSTPNANSVIAGGISLFSSGFAFVITALSLDVDKTFHEVKNQTSFAKNLGDEGKYGFALAISASTFLTSFLIARNYLKKFDLQNNNQNNDIQISGEIGFSHRYQGNSNPRTSFANINSSISSITNSDNSR